MWKINPHGKYIAADRSLQIVSQISDAISRFTINCFSIQETMISSSTDNFLAIVRVSLSRIIKGTSGRT